MRREVKLMHVDEVYEDKCRVSQKILITKIEMCGIRDSHGMSFNDARFNSHNSYKISNVKDLN